ncbi:MAG TPA: tetratricopeptide repeat protein [Anaerolineales bacterium]|nr:tetratricopeptide repeat protein [Anaerolineales bacterium]
MLTYFNEIADFINNINENIGVLLTIAIATSLLIVVIALLYLATHKNKLGRNTKALIAGISVVVLFASIGFGWYSYNAKKVREQKFVIAIADFYTTNQKDYGVTEDISHKLSQLLADEPDMIVELLNRPITEADGSDEAIIQGEGIDADIVLWGWYTVTQTDVLVTIHIEDLTPQPTLTTDFVLPESYQIQVDIFKIDTFELQKSISEDFSSIAFFIKGKSIAENGNTNEAIDYFSKAIQKETSIDKWYFYYARGYTYANSARDLVSAIKDLETATKTIPLQNSNASYIYNTLGVAYFYSEDFNKAKEAQTFALELELGKEKPDELFLAVTLTNIGSDVANIGDCEIAIDYFIQALTYAKEEDFAGHIHLQRGLCYRRLGRDQDAIPDLDHAIAIFERIKETDLKNSFRMSYLNRGEIYEGIGDTASDIWGSKGFYEKVVGDDTALLESKTYYEKAVDDYTAAIKVDSEYDLAYLTRGRTYLKLYRYDESEDDLLMAIYLNPDDIRSHIILSKVYFEQGLQNQAFQELSIANQIDLPQTANDYWQRALYFTSLKLYDQSISDCTQAILLDPLHGECYFTRGSNYMQLLMETNNPSEFEELRTKALDDLIQVTRIEKDPNEVRLAEEMIEIIK